MATAELNLSLWPRQFQAFTTEATELLFGGATEGGKSHFIRVSLIAWCLDIPNLQCVLIRKKYQDILDNHVEGPTGFRVLLDPVVTAKLVRITDSDITFPNGSRIAFVHCQDERQFNSAQGVEKHVLVIDEATQITERLIRFFRTWVRMPNQMKAELPERWKGKFPRIIYTANPIGVSVPFFRRCFVDLCVNESIVSIEGFKRQYLLSRYTDNWAIDEEAHKGRLDGIGDEKIAKALDLGDWKAITGEMFPEWDESRHVIQYDFAIPAHWTKFRTFDWGGADPFAVYWMAYSDGEVFIDTKGKKRWLPRGALIVYREWYGCDEKKPSQGIRLRNEAIADGILRASDYEDRDVPTLTDSFPFAERGGVTIADVFKEHGVTLTLGDTSRAQGWALMRSRLIGYEFEPGEKIPLLFIHHSCKYARDYIPALPRHPAESKPEDAAEHGEATHACDAIRLGCTAHTVIKDKIQITDEQIRKALKSNKLTMQRILKRSGNGMYSR